MRAGQLPQFPASFGGAGRLRQLCSAGTRRQGKGSYRADSRLTVQLSESFLALSRPALPACAPRYINFILPSVQVVPPFSLAPPPLHAFQPLDRYSFCPPSPPSLILPRRTCAKATLNNHRRNVGAPIMVTRVIGHAEFQTLVEGSEPQPEPCREHFVTQWQGKDPGLVRGARSR